MHPTYETGYESFEVFKIRNRHYGPHLHPLLECVYLERGSLAVGHGTSLHSMKAGDFALIFPNTIHHYQTFSSEVTRSVCLLADTTECERFAGELSGYAPQCPVIPSEKLNPEIRHALQSLLSLKKQVYLREIRQAYLQIILAESLPMLELVDKKSVGTEELIYEVISYISSHFREEMTLNTLAQSLGISPYVISRIFSSTYHTNFNSYLNDVRLRYAASQLTYSTKPITEIAMEAGFSSLRTFNRFFKEKLRMTPREYRQHQLNWVSGEDAKE